MPLCFMKFGLLPNFCWQIYKENQICPLFVINSNWKLAEVNLIYHAYVYLFYRERLRQTSHSKLMQIPFKLKFQNKICFLPLVLPRAFKSRIKETPAQSPPG